MKTSFSMIDVGKKQITFRLAIARGEISVGQEAFALIAKRELPKGDALMLAEIAGIQGAKKAFEMLPLCHPMLLDQVKVITELDENNHKVICYCIASTHAKTGIEMEVLAGVNAALLTIWDLSKMINADLQISNIELVLKLGGKSGVWKNPRNFPDWAEDLIPKPKPAFANRKIAIITLSDRASAGEYEDKSGKNLIDIVKQNNGEICDYIVIPDEAIAIKDNINSIIKKSNPHLIICTGGTGVAKRDLTPETITPLFDKIIPGVGEILRQDGAKFTPLSWSSRSVAGVIGETLVVTLPGNPKAVIEGMSALLPDLLPHLIRIIRGE